VYVMLYQSVQARSSYARLSAYFNSRAIEFQIPLPLSDNAVLKEVLM
jgi:hypothetical protein